MFDGYISPLKIRVKTYGGSWRKKQNILLEFENEKYDSKSCNDSENPDDNFSNKNKPFLSYRKKYLFRYFF